jgi:hypothetical protein
VQNREECGLWSRPFTLLFSTSGIFVFPVVKAREVLEIGRLRLPFRFSRFLLLSQKELTEGIGIFLEESLLLLSDLIWGCWMCHGIRYMMDIQFCKANDMEMTLY